MALEKEKLNSYAYLPEDLLVRILEKTPETAQKLAALINVGETSISEGREILDSNSMICSLSSEERTDSFIAVDGANILERMTGSDLLMAIAVGVEGLPDEPSEHWAGNSNSEQYYQWQEVLPHHVANARLCQGVMFLMELSILANSSHQIRIMDGSHITSIIKINSLLTAQGQEFADQKYVQALNNFLSDNYSQLIPDIPQIIESAFSSPGIIGLAKYSSSRELLDSQLKKLDIPGDDKTFFSLCLNGGEFTKPLPVGQSEKDNTQWEFAHIKCNLDIGSESQKEELNKQFEMVLEKIRPSREAGSQLYFSYFKPYAEGICYRIEMKEDLAKNENILHRTLSSIKHQIFFPDIHEPYPQYLADIIAKNISFGMEAVIQAIRSNEALNNEKNFHFMLSYRSK